VVARTSQALLNGLNDVGRVVISAFGQNVFFETSDALDVTDTNGVRDIYLNDQISPGVRRTGALWISKPTTGTGAKTSFSPATTLDGGSVFFISESPLVVADTDRRNSLYRADVSAGTVTLNYLSTPLALADLSPQASPTGSFIAYLGEVSGATTRAYLLDADTAIETPLLPNNVAEIAPLLSNDERTYVFASAASNLTPHDNNGSEDVFADTPPGAPAAQTPLVTLSGLSTTSQDEAAQFSLSASANAAEVPLISIEFSGNTITSGPTSISNFQFSENRGVYVALARAFDGNWVEGLSTPTTVTVFPPAGVLAITDNLDLVQTPNADGTISFTSTLQIDNRRTTTSGALQVVLTAAWAPAAIPGFGDTNSVPSIPGNTIGLFDLADLPSGGETQLVIGGLVPPTEAVGNGFQGVSWVVTATLQEQSGNSFSVLETYDLFTAPPRLNENTPGPSGGVVVTSTVQGNQTFNPPLLQSIKITGPSTVAEGSQASYSAIATFTDNSTASIAPNWSTNNLAATISVSGVLTAKTVRTATSIQVTAQFGGKSQQATVSIVPVSPVVSIVADEATAEEGGKSGDFKILRSPITAGPLSVSYAVSGTAQAGVDYTALTGSATIPAGASYVKIPLTTLQHSKFEGNLNATLTLASSPDFRLSSTRTATVTILDDLPLPAGQPDAAIRFGSLLVGANVYDRFPPTTQAIAENAVLNHALTFTFTVSNHDTVAHTYTISGAIGALGYAVQYLSGKEDVSAAVTASSSGNAFAFKNVAPNTAQELTVKITPTTATPLGGKLACVLSAVSDTSLSDVVEADATRVR
jgi:hypothetical protein